MPLGRSTCCPMYVTDVDGWLAPCDRFYRIWSFTWTAHPGIPTLILQVEDKNGRTHIYAKNNCHMFQAYTRPLEMEGIFIRTLGAGTTLYLQVE